MNNEEQINFEDYLAKYGSLTYKNKGTSMMPLLRQDRDLFTIVKKGPERCRRNDVVLYKDEHDRYILHRVIKVVPDGYIIRGDNTYRKEFRTDAEIRGVMTSLIRDGKEISTEDLFYKLYSVLRNASYPFRYVYIHLRRAAGKLLERNKG